MNDHDTDEARAKTIQEHNDAFREQGIGRGQVLITPGIQSLGDHEVVKVIAKVQAFDTFTENNDPHGEHDFGAFTHQGHKIVWKIDLYEPTLTRYTDDPTNPAKTHRVLTIMLANEY